MEDKDKILNLLPCRMGDDFVNTVVSIGFSPDKASKILASLIDDVLVEIVDDNYVLTKIAKRMRENDVSVKDGNIELKLKKSTEKIIKEDIVWDSRKRRIHPAMHFEDDIAYTIAYLNTKTKIVEDKIEKVVEVESPFIVTSEKDLIKTDCLPEDVVLLEQPKIPKGNDFLIRETSLSKYPSQNAVKRFIEGSEIVSFKEVFEEVREKFEFFMDYDETRYYSFCAVWSMGTFFHHLFSGYPYLFLNAVKGAGKSKNICCLAYCSFCPEIVVDPSVASLFRTIQSERCSFFLDEAEKVPTKKDSSEIRTLLLSGYKKGAGISRTKEVENKKLKGFESVTFDIYSPKVMGNIRGIEDIMESRCITMVLKKTMDSMVGGRNLPNKKFDPTFQPIRDRLFFNQMLNWKEVKKNYELLEKLLETDNLDGFEQEDVENIKTNLIGRNWELWHPLLAVSLCVSKEVFKEILSLAIDLTKERVGDELAENYESTVVRILCQKIEKTDWYSTSILAKEMNDYEGLSHLTGTSLTNIMKRIGLKSKTVPNRKIANKHYAFIDMEVLKDCAKRMNMDYDEIRSEELSFAPVPKKEKLLNIIRELEIKYKDGVPRFDIKYSARLFYPEEELDKMLERFQTEGVVYSPRPNVYLLVKSAVQKNLKDIEIDTPLEERDEESIEKEDEE